MKEQTILLESIIFNGVEKQTILKTDDLAVKEAIKIEKLKICDLQKQVKDYKHLLDYSDENFRLSLSNKRMSIRILRSMFGYVKLKDVLELLK